MDASPETAHSRQLQKIDQLFRTHQGTKALSAAAKALTRCKSPDDRAALFSLCVTHGAHEFVLHALKKSIKTEVSILADLELFALTVGQLPAGHVGKSGEPVAWLRDTLKKLLPRVNSPSQFIIVLSVRMGFAIESPRETVEFVFEEFILPLMKALLEQESVSDALVLESFAYDVYVKQRDGEAGFHAFLERVAPPMRAATTANSHGEIARSVPELPATNSPIPVAFIIHNTSLLAHVNAMLGFFRGLNELEARKIEPVIFALDGEDAGFVEACRTLGVRCELLGPGRDYAGKLSRVKQQLADEGFPAVVWLCLANWMPYAYSLRLAPVQIWWSMKFHDYKSRDIDGYLCRFFPPDDFYDGHWRGGFLTVDSLFDESKTDEARRLRSSLDAELVFGTLGRAELINDPEFLGTVVSLLQAHPKAVYLWTGRAAPAEIVEFFRSAGVEPQCRFIGWVDTKLYAQVFDIYLDVFKFGTGFTLVEAMAAGKPVIFLDRPRDFSVLQVLRGIIAQGLIQLDESEQSLLKALVAESPDHFGELTLHIAKSDELRNDTGALLQKLSNVFLDRATSAAIYQDHIDAIIRETLTQQHSPD